MGALYQGTDTVLEVIQSGGLVASHTQALRMRPRH